MGVFQLNEVYDSSLACLFIEKSNDQASEKWKNWMQIIFLIKKQS